MRQMTRSRSADSSIGWVSFSDTILFAFGLAIVFASSVSDALISKTEDYDSLNSDHNVLVSEHESILKELEKTRPLLAEAERAIAEMNERLAETNGRLAESNERLAETKVVLAGLREESESLRNERDALKRGKDELESQFARARTIYLSQKNQITDLLVQVEDSAKALSELAVTRNELEVVQANYEEMLERSQQRERDERRVRGELLGLKGPLERVAVVFDASQSMTTGDRWDAAQQVMLDWVDYLDMKECKLVVFNDRVVEYPSGESLLTLRGEEGKEDREKMRRFLQSVEPAGRTNTLAALEAAYRIEGLDTIVLFTDGAPYVSGDQQRYDSEMVEEVYALCAGHPEVPINAVGLGDYFSPELSAFLLRVSEMTRGTFIGR